MSEEKGFYFDFDSEEGRVIIKSGYGHQYGEAELLLKLDHKELLRAMAKSTGNKFDDKMFEIIYGEKIEPEVPAPAPAE